MKNYWLISMLLAWLHTAAAQNTNFTDSILNRVLLDEIAVFDQNLQAMNNLNVRILNRERVVNCQWTRPKFVDNIFQDSFDGVLIQQEIVFDTATHANNSAFLDFTYPLTDETGNYLRDTIAFSICNKNTSNPLRQPNATTLKLLNNTTWINKRIELDGNNLELDSCHALYRLQLNEDQTFTQHYGAGVLHCSTALMEEKKTVGVEGDVDEFVTYADKLQGHYIDMPNGNWRVAGNELRLVNLANKMIRVFNIEKLNPEVLELSIPGEKYVLHLAKSNR